MKVTEKRLDRIQKSVQNICSALNVDAPKTLVSKEEYETWKTQKRNEMGHGMFGRPSADRFGSVHRKDKVIFIDTNRIKTADKLNTEICSLLVRYAKPSYNLNSTEVKNRTERLLALGGDSLRNGRFIPKRMKAKVKTVVKSETVKA